MRAYCVIDIPDEVVIQKGILINGTPTMKGVVIVEGKIYECVDFKEKPAKKKGVGGGKDWISFTELGYNEAIDKMFGGTNGSK